VICMAGGLPVVDGRFAHLRGSLTVAAQLQRRLGASSTDAPRVVIRSILEQV
jgi:hypothetical protein